MSDSLFFRGSFISTPAAAAFDCREDSYLTVRGGRIVGFSREPPAGFREDRCHDFGRNFVIPGFVDLHVHAPQYFQAGRAMDVPLLQWLERYTFPLESRFSHAGFAREVYSRFASALLHNGTLHAAVLGTVHKESTTILGACLAEAGIGAYVGKINMDRHGPPSLCENLQRSLQETEALAGIWQDGIVRPIVTPRFAPACSEELLEGLGELVSRLNLPVQSHLAENQEEVAWVKTLFPGSKGYAHVYERYGLLGETPTLMAHAIYLEEEELSLLRRRNVILVHCPEANLNLSSGVMPLRRWWQRGLRIALGSDVGAGHDLYIPRVMVRAIQLSKLHHGANPAEEPLTLAEAFYLGTRAGGSFFGPRGSFAAGHFFDALVVEDDPFFSAGLSLEERLERFIYSGDSSQICYRLREGCLIG